MEDIICALYTCK